MIDRTGVRRSWVARIFLLALVAPAGLNAQGFDLLTGLVQDLEGRPLVNVTIEAVSIESDILRTTVTDQDGRYTILFPDGGGQYRMTARRIGMVPVDAVLIRYADEAQLVWDVQLRTQAIRLEDIEVTADAPVDVAALEALLGRELTAEELENLPADVTDLAMLSLFLDGGSLIDATDSTDAMLAVNGLDPEANVVTIDGVETSITELPMEGLEQVEISAGSYDVADGGYGGAVVEARTRGGSNNVRGSVRYSLQNSGLTFGETDLTPFGRGRTQNSFSGGVGGPLIRNKLFVNLSGSVGLQSDPLRSLSTANQTDLQRLGVAPDSVSRLLDLANDFGMMSDREFGTSRSDRGLNGIVRLDFLASDRHTFSLTARAVDSRDDPTSQSQLSLPDAGGTSTRASLTSTLTLASQFGRRVTSQLRISGERDRRVRSPFLYTPQARVRVASELEDGSTGVTTLVLGGNTGMPSTQRSTGFSISEGISWLSAAGGHRVRFGGDVAYQRNINTSSSNQLGTYTFNSIADFESGIPASFQRVLAPSERVRRNLSFGLYASDTWRLSPAVQLNAGLQFRGAGDPRPPAYNPQLDAVFGYRTDFVPSSFFLGPSASATWTIAGADRRRPALIVRGGARLTGSRSGGRYLDNAYRATGLETDEREINCIGAGIPAPDWNAFGLDAGVIPASCEPGGEVEFDGDGLAPTATVFSREYAEPRYFRTSLSLQRYVTSFLRATVIASFTRGYRMPSVTDLNLDPNRGFQLADETNRPVFVPVSAVDTATGEVRLTDSRTHEEFGSVSAVSSGGASESVQLNAQLRGATNGGITISGSYQVASSRRLSTGFDAGTVSGNPNELEWATNGNDRRHQISLSVGYPIGSSVEINARGRFVSGNSYTPTVGSDINGDGRRNDRAFVFAPDAPGVDQSVAQGMQQLLSSTSGSARQCLETQFGQIAERSSCRGPWSTSLDFSLSYRPAFWGLDRRLAFNVSTSNFLRGLDDLIHGSDKAHGWGMTRRPEATLLFVNGFDPSTGTFSYLVNERFGVADPRAFASRAPFQLTVSARLQIGSDRRRAAIDRLRGLPPRPTERGAGASTTQTFKNRLNNMVVNPAAMALELGDSLQLSDTQRRQLQVLRDSATATRDSIAASVESRMREDGVDPRQLAQLLRDAMQQAIANLPTEIAAVRRVLSEEQWLQMPDVVRNSDQLEQRR